MHIRWPAGITGNEATDRRERETEMRVEMQGGEATLKSSRLGSCYSIFVKGLKVWML